MERKIIPYGFQSTPLDFFEPLNDWLCQQAAVESWLLAHAIDGVIWGWASTDYIATSHDIAGSISPPLRLETLQQLRLFNANNEVRLWRDGSKWCAIRITDVSDPNAAAIDEHQLLWGTFAEQLADGFVRLEDGTQGLVHVIPPFDGSNQLNGELGLYPDEQLTRVALRVRHYLTEDVLGVNTITMSRLLNLEVNRYA